ncbi:MAG: type II toxin-antitoxin system prevent-host-death family antitoxin [Acidimicrobiales bacterium]
MDVGVRELKSKLSEYLGRVASGEAITVTDRGKPIARLVGIDEGSAIDRGIEQGWIDAPRRTSLEPIARVRVRTSVLEVLDEDRG